MGRLHAEENRRQRQYFVGTGCVASRRRLYDQGDRRRMKCSDCSKRVKPIVVSDIDGTLSMYHEAITSFSARYFGTDAPRDPYYGDEPFRDYLGLTQEQHRAMKLAYRQGGNKRFVTPWFD